VLNLLMHDHCVTVWKLTGIIWNGLQRKSTMPRLRARINTRRRYPGRRWFGLVGYRVGLSSLSSPIYE